MIVYFSANRSSSQYNKRTIGTGQTLHDRTVLLVQNITEVLGFCLYNTYFSFQNKFYEQVEGAAMESLVSPIVVNLYMEYFKGKALSSDSTSPRYWFRFVDGTFVIQQEAHEQIFLDHINKVYPKIKFTVESNQENFTISFLDTLAKPEADNSLSISVYRKPTHTDQYLQWNSHHNLGAKYSVISTLTHQAKTVCTGSELFNKDYNTFGRLCTNVKTLSGAINKVQSKFLNSNWEGSNIQEGTTEKGADSTSGNTTRRNTQGKAQQRTNSYPIHPRPRRKY